MFMKGYEWIIVFDMLSSARLPCKQKPQSSGIVGDQRLRAAEGWVEWNNHNENMKKNILILISKLLVVLVAVSNSSYEILLVVISHLEESHVMKDVAICLANCHSRVSTSSWSLTDPAVVWGRWRRATEGDEEVIPLHGRPSNRIRSVRKQGKKCWFNRSSTINVGVLKVDLVQDFIALHQEALSTWYTNCFVDSCQNILCNEFPVQ